MTVNGERAVVARAREQFGLISRGQALELEVHPDRIRRRVCSGQWEAVHAGVYALAGAPPSWDRKVLAAVLATGPDSLASHGTALKLHEIEGGFEGRIAVTVAGTTPRVVPRVVAHRSLVISPVDRTTAAGIPVTSVARTLADCSGMLSLGRLARSLDDALVRNLVTRAEVAEVAARLGSAPGRRISRLRLLVAERGPEADTADSRPEMRMFRIIRAAGLPEPVSQHPVRLNGEKFFIDVSYPYLRLAFEYQGFDAHRTRSAFNRDYRRVRMLVADGWIVLFFTSADSDAEIVESIRPLVA